MEGATIPLVQLFEPPRALCDDVYLHQRVLYRSPNINLNNKRKIKGGRRIYNKSQLTFHNQLLITYGLLPHSTAPAGKQRLVNNNKWAQVLDCPCELNK